MESEQAIIVDNGSGFIKAGVSTDAEPRFVIPNVFGVPRDGIEGRDELEATYFGKEVQSHRMFLKCSYPINSGIITDFDLMEDMWQHVFDKLEVDPSKHPMLISEPPRNPDPIREEMLEVMFEQFDSPLVNIATTGIMALYNTGRTTGLVLDSGDGVTYALPVMEGFGHPVGLQMVDYAGRDLDVLLGKLLAKRKSRRFTTSADQLEVRLMKETHCYVSDRGVLSTAERSATYTLPDGRELELDEELWRVPESLFRPSLLGFEDGTPGVARLVWDALQSVPIDYRTDVMGGVVLSGGSTMFSGFSGRLQTELRQLAPSGRHGASKIAPGQRSGDNRCAVWCGAQVFASLRQTCAAESGRQWISKQRYKEHGPSIVHDVKAMKFR